MSETLQGTVDIEITWQGPHRESLPARAPLLASMRSLSSLRPEQCASRESAQRTTSSVEWHNTANATARYSRVIARLKYFRSTTDEHS
jgi:hypothetical protein